MPPERYVGSPSPRSCLPITTHRQWLPYARHWPEVLAHRPCPAESNGGLSKHWPLLRPDLAEIRTKRTKWTVRPAKIQISLGILPVWSESLLCAQWVAKDSSFLHADSEDSDPSLRWPHSCFVGFVTWGGSFGAVTLNRTLLMTIRHRLWSYPISEISEISDVVDAAMMTKPRKTRIMPSVYTVTSL